MNIRKYITKKNVIIGAVAGTAIIGGIVALIVRHHKKKEIDEFLSEEEDFDLDYFGDEFWDEDLDDDDEEGRVMTPTLALAVEREATIHEITLEVVDCIEMNCGEDM